MKLHCNKIIHFFEFDAIVICCYLVQYRSEVSSTRDFSFALFAGNSRNCLLLDRQFLRVFRARELLAQDLNNRQIFIGSFIAAKFAVLKIF